MCLHGGGAVEVLTMLFLDPRGETSRPLADSVTMAAGDEGLQEVGKASNLQW